MSKVQVYVTTYCSYCTQAKRYLERLGVAYESIDVTHDDQRRAWLVQQTGMRTVPQIFVGATSVGGYTDMVALDRSGGFRPLLNREGIAFTDGKA